MLVKEKIHKIIDKIEDQERLENYLNLILNLENCHEGRLFSALSSEQKQELLMSYEESYDDQNLIENSTVKEKYSKWL